MEQKSISGIILAGGLSKRLGREKTTLTLGGSTVLRSLIEKLRPLVSEILVVTRREQKLFFPDVRIVSDIFPGKGSLGGLYTGLSHASNHYSFICACDMPFISPQLIRFLLNRKKNGDAVVPKISGYFEPLCAVYAKSCLPLLHKNLTDGNLKITNFYNRITVHIPDENEIRRIDPRLLSFFNINSDTDYKKAIRIFKNQN